MRNLLSSRMFVFLMVLTIASTVGLQSWRTLFDNFAVNVVHLDGYHIGIIQSVRELPGLLSLLVVYVLFILQEHKLSALSVLLLGFGVCITGLMPSFGGLIFTTLIMSFGFHYFETTNQSLSLQHFSKTESPLILGRLRSFSAASNIVTGILIFILATFLSYTQIYIFFGALIIGASLWALRYNPLPTETLPLRRKMIVRKRYWLYYCLTFMAGARRQIFVAFAVFLLVQKFHFSVQEIAILFLINNVINFFLSPLIGKFINSFGERNLLSLEYFSLLIIFYLYATVDSKMIVAFLYIADHIFFNFAISIRTFFHKISQPEDIAPTMAVGFTINHIAAVVLPAVGGMLWLIDYQIVFFFGGLLSLISLFLVQFIPRQLKLYNS